jgi:hypothetical protein
VLPVRETLERADGVVADGRYTESLLPDRVQVLFQLDELDFAERSHAEDDGPGGIVPESQEAQI